jgi:hypothetical protein
MSQHQNAPIPANSNFIYAVDNGESILDLLLPYLLAGKDELFMATAVPSNPTFREMATHYLERTLHVEIQDKTADAQYLR